MARVRLQSITPEMEQFFQQIQSYFHASLSGTGSSGPREATLSPAQPSPVQLKNNRRKKSGNLGSGISAPPPRSQLTSAAAPPNKPTAQKLKGSCGGNQPRLETPPLEYSLNCAELKNTLTPKKDLLSAFKYLSSGDWYVFWQRTASISSSVFHASMSSNNAKPEATSSFSSSSTSVLGHSFLSSWFPW